MRAAERRIRELAERLGFTIDPGARVDQLSLGQQQRVEILKAIYRGARTLVLDEPTAVLTPQETSEIFGVLRRLREEGTRHHLHQPKLDEASWRRGPRHRDPPRQGRRNAEARGPNENELAELMVGRCRSMRVTADSRIPAEVMLEVSGLRAMDDRTT